MSDLCGSSGAPSHVLRHSGISALFVLTYRCGGSAGMASEDAYQTSLFTLLNRFEQKRT